MTISRCYMAFLSGICAWLLAAPAYAQTYPFTHWEWPNWAEIGSMLRLGVPIGITYFAEVSAFGVLPRFGLSVW